MKYLLCSETHHLTWLFFQAKLKDAAEAENKVCERIARLYQKENASMLCDSSNIYTFSARVSDQFLN